MHLRHFKLLFIDAVFRTICFLNLSQCKIQKEKGNLWGILKTFVTSDFKWSMDSPLVHFFNEDISISGKRREVQNFILIIKKPIVLLYLLLLYILGY